MSAFMDNLQRRVSAGASATARFYRGNTTLLLSAFTILSVLLIVWARLGFTFEIGRFFAAEHIPSVLTVQCGETQNVLTWTLPEGHDSNAVNRGVDGGNATQIGMSPMTATTWTDTNVSAGHTYRYVHKAWADTPSNAVICAPTTTADPNAPPAGTMVGVCTGGATPSITLRYSKLPPPGTTLPVNSNGMNKGTTAPDGARSAEQLATFNPTDKGQYWEWTDTNVQSGYTYDYRAKYHPEVGTNIVTIVASPANCGAVVSPLPCAPLGMAPRNPSLGPSNQIYNGTCCQGLEEKPYTVLGGVVGVAPTRCVAPGCYYQQVQCFTEPCYPILVCPSPTASPACIPLGSRINPKEDSRLCCEGLTAVHTFDIENRGIDDILYCAPPGCTYHEVQCIRAPCNPELVCPTCEPRPACLDATPACDMPEPANGWCPPPTCVPRPACMNEDPPCMLDLLPGTTLCPETLTCAPVSQKVEVREEARVEAAGGTGTYTWSAYQGTDKVTVDASGRTAVVVFTRTGTHTVQVTSGVRTASCQVQVVSGGGGGTGSYTHLECENNTCVRVPGQAANECSSDGASCDSADTQPLVVILTARNVSTGGAESDAVAVRTGQQVELRIRISNRFSSSTIGDITVEAALPAGFTYVPGSTAVRGMSVSADTVAAGGFSIGGLGAGQDALVTFRATVGAAGFAAGTTQVQAAARARASGVQDVSDMTGFSVTRPSTGTGGTGGTGAVKTGPGEALLAAFLVSAVMTLLYVSYTQTSTYKRHEVSDISKQRDPLDFRS